MSQLLLLRHAAAAKAAFMMSDFDRPLAEEGRASLEVLANAISEAKLFPDRILVSASSRTRETASVLTERLGRTIETIVDDMLYNGGTIDYLDSIKRHGNVDRLMLVGHNPTISDLALALTGEGTAHAISRLISGFSPSNMATISFETALSDIETKQGRLESFPLP